MTTDLIKPYPGEDEISFAKRRAYFFRFMKHRLAYGEEVIGRYMPNGVPITPAEKEEIDDFWNQYLTPQMRDLFIDYRYYNVFKKVLKPGQRLCYYIPDAFYNSFLDDYFTNPQESRPCNHKNFYDMLFCGAKQPKTVFRKLCGIYLDANYKEISLKEAISRSKDVGEVVLKIGKNSSGGKGVMFWNHTVDDEEKLINFLNSSNDILCQEAIKQHEDLSRLNPTSINTLRMLTFYFNNKVYMLSSFIRFGAEGSRLDNINSGGFACGVNSDGRLKNVALDITGAQIDHRPQGKCLNEIIVPNYDKCVELVTDLAKRFVIITRMIGWDIAVDENANPVVIEFGPTYCGCNFHQLCNGPVFGDLTPDVMKEFFSNNYTMNNIIKSLER